MRLLSSLFSFIGPVSLSSRQILLIKFSSQFITPFNLLTFFSELNCNSLRGAKVLFSPLGKLFAVLLWLKVSSITCRWIIFFCTYKWTLGREEKKSYPETHFTQSELCHPEAKRAFGIWCAKCFGGPNVTCFAKKSANWNQEWNRATSHLLNPLSLSLCTLGARV